MNSRRILCALALALLTGAGLVAQSRQAPAPQPTTLTLRIIIVGTSDEAAQVKERLTLGESFAAAARRVSIDPSAADGGLLGRLDLSTLSQAIQAAVRGLRVGQVSAVVPVATGFALIQVVPDSGEARASAINPASLAAISAVGGVKYAPDIGGLPEAEALLRDFPKAAAWNEDPRAICQVRQDSLSAGQDLFESFLSPAAAEIRKGRSPFELMQAQLGRAQLLAYQGSMARAVEGYEQAYHQALAGVPGAVAQVEEMLAVAYLHKAGMDSDVFRHPDDRCLLPTGPGRPYAKTADVEKAVSLFTSVLQRKPEDIEVRWLLNVAYMALGTWPDAVPPKLRVEPSAFASGEDVGRFPDVARQAGLDVFASAGGVIVDDLTGSGRLDVVTSNFYSCGPMHYFGNNGDGTYSERTAAAGLRDQVGGLNLVQADYNNDRCTDILVLRGGWEVPQRNSLLRNNCNGTFTDVTAEAGLAVPPTSTQTAAWADVNNDGWLDLFVGNEDTRAQLFLNDGMGHFTDIATQAGVDRSTFAKGVTAGDFDNDGFVDFYVSNYDGTNQLYRNNHDNTFTERAAAAGVPGAGRGFATWFFDYDNDGWLDLFVTSYFMSVDDSARTYLNLPHNAPSLKLYRNRGNGTFEDVTHRVGLDKVFMPMGANFGDIDNDGFLDIYLGMGSPSYAALVPHVLLRNQGGQRFVDVTASSGTGELHKGHGVAFADLDNDGDEDIIAEIGGATPGDSHAMRVFENPGHGNDWLSVKLSGITTNRSAIGARLAVTVENEAGRRTIYRQVGTGGTFGASPLEQHVGLGRHARILDVDITWPASGTRQHFTNVPVNQAIAVEEGAASFTAIARTRTPLGGARRTP
jgi:tetratricopeptide (TPR) repeat protein